MGRRVDGIVQLVVRRLADDLPHGAAVWQQRPWVDRAVAQEVEDVTKRRAVAVDEVAAVRLRPPAADFSCLSTYRLTTYVR